MGVVAGREVPVAVLDARLAALRAGPFADRLPPADCLAGRQLRRWVAQLVLTEELVHAEAVRLGVGDPGQHGDRAAGPDSICSPADGPVASGWAVPAGGLAGAVLAGMPLARALYRRVTAEIRADDRQARDYYRHNPDLWCRPERRDLLHLLSAWPADPARLHAEGTRWSATRAELPEPLAGFVFTATPGRTVGPTKTHFGWHLCLVEGISPSTVDTFDAVRSGILATLTRSRRRQHFERWLEQRRAELVVVQPGCEHPGDPRHSDYTHHH